MSHVIVIHKLVCVLENGELSFELNVHFDYIIKDDLHIFGLNLDVSVSPISYVIII